VKYVFSNNDYNHSRILYIHFTQVRETSLTIQELQELSSMPPPPAKTSNIISAELPRKRSVLRYKRRSYYNTSADCWRIPIRDSNVHGTWHPKELMISSVRYVRYNVPYPHSFPSSSDLSVAVRISPAPSFPYPFLLVWNLKAARNAR